MLMLTTRFWGRVASRSKVGYIEFLERSSPLGKLGLNLVCCAVSHLMIAYLASPFTRQNLASSSSPTP